MDNYIIKKYAQCDLPLLKKDWQSLENGKEMSYYQTFDWYESMNDIVPSKGVVVFIEVLRGEEVKLIAPLWIMKHTYLWVNKRGCYFWGREGFGDYLNFIYQVFDEKALEALFVFIKTEYGTMRYFLEFLKKETGVVTYLENYFSDIQKTSFSYAAITLPNDVNNYVKSLSKHARQNLRTAHNRSIKDGVSFECSIIEKCSNVQLRQKCEQIRQQRLPFKQQREKKEWSWLTKLHLFIDSKLRISIPYKSVLDVEKNGNLLLITCGEDVAAFFYYGLEKQNGKVVVMTAGTNTKYARYSPGFYYMFQQIQNWINDDTINSVDFTRGNEKYKYDLGCEHFPVCNISFIYQ